MSGKHDIAVNEAPKEESRQRERSETREEKTAVQEGKPRTSGSFRIKRHEEERKRCSRAERSCAHEDEILPNGHGESRNDFREAPLYQGALKKKSPHTNALV